MCYCNKKKDFIKHANESKIMSKHGITSHDVKQAADTRYTSDLGTTETFSIDSITDRLDFKQVSPASAALAEPSIGPVTSAAHAQRPGSGQSVD